MSDDKVEAQLFKIALAIILIYVVVFTTFVLGGERTVDISDRVPGDYWTRDNSGQWLYCIENAKSNDRCVRVPEFVNRDEVV